VANQYKLPKDMMPRILEDEGFYVQRKPEICKKICSKMENRLVKLEEASVPANKIVTYSILHLFSVKYSITTFYKYF
jgi:hypothetical protein